MNTYDKFLNPCRDYTTVPFWFWNGKIEFDEITRQLELMSEQKVYQCVIHARNGLETQYLSEEWFECIDLKGDYFTIDSDDGCTFFNIDKFIEDFSKAMEE